MRFHFFTGTNGRQQYHHFSALHLKIMRTARTRMARCEPAMILPDRNASSASLPQLVCQQLLRMDTKKVLDKATQEMNHLKRHFLVVVFQALGEPPAKDGEACYCDGTLPPAACMSEIVNHDPCATGLSLRRGSSDLD